MESPCSLIRQRRLAATRSNRSRQEQHRAKPLTRPFGCPTVLLLDGGCIRCGGRRHCPCDGHVFLEFAGPGSVGAGGGTESVNRFSHTPDLSRHLRRRGTGASRFWRRVVDLRAREIERGRAIVLRSFEYPRNPAPGDCPHRFEEIPSDREGDKSDQPFAPFNKSLELCRRSDKGILIS